MSEAYVTLATNDSYAFGAATLSASIRKTGTTRPIVCMVTTGVSPLMRVCLERFFDRLVFVDVFDSNDEANLALLGRPELGCTFTKLSCWRLTDYTKCVFLDADTLVLGNIDDLFQRDELSACPDLGWPDCFNSGVYVYCPSEQTYRRLIEFATTVGSFDGGDQGLLNSFFSDWAHKDISRHLPYVYNCAFTAAPYSYLPALKHFFQNLKVIHYLGALKPWLFPLDSEGMPLLPPNLELHECSMRLVVSWWNFYNSDVKGKLTEGVEITSGSNVTVTPSYGTGMSAEEEDNLHRAAWESGYVEYHGRDSFQSIKTHIDQVMAKPAPAVAVTAAPPQAYHQPAPQAAPARSVPPQPVQPTQQRPVQQQAPTQQQYHAPPQQVRGPAPTKSSMSSRRK